MELGLLVPLFWIAWRVDDLVKHIIENWPARPTTEEDREDG